MSAIQHLMEANERARREGSDPPRRVSVGSASDLTDTTDEDEVSQADTSQGLTETLLVSD
jgi:hypothetical protein